MREEADPGLLEAARSGDALALEQLLERHQAQVYRFGMKMCRDPEDARDVLQRAMETRCCSLPESCDGMALAR
jgi:RNA polymerase sigma-70 factor (ECF subfamily)